MSSALQAGNSSAAAKGAVALPCGGAVTSHGAGVVSSANNKFHRYYMCQFLADAGTDDFRECFLSGSYDQMVGYVRGCLDK